MIRQNQNEDTDTQRRFGGEGMNKEELEELKNIRRLLIALLLRDGVEAQTIAEVLQYKSKSSITNEFPVRKLQNKNA